MDQYFVVSGDGKEFGPVDLIGLQQWVREGRVLESTLIRKDSAEPAEAGTLPEIAVVFTAAPPLATPPIAGVLTLPTEFRSWVFIGQAWDLVKPHWLPLGVMFLITAAIGAVPYLGGSAMIIIGGAIYIGINRAILGLLAGRPPTIPMMFEGFDRFGQALLATLVVGGLVVLGFVCLLVPGIILGIMWMFVSLIMAETNLDFWPAMQASAKLTAGYRWNLFFLGLACLVVALLGILAFCIGIFIAEAVIFTALALAYRFLQARQAGHAA